MQRHTTENIPVELTVIVLRDHNALISLGQSGVTLALGLWSYVLGQEFAGRAAREKKERHMDVHGEIAVFSWQQPV